jgi:DNA-directed RNA polymerase subunit RPC12/RpoP
MVAIMKKIKRKLPKYLLTYLCKKCGMDFALSELHKPACFYCGSKQGHELVKKQKLTPKVLADRMKRVADRLVENLKKAYDVKPADADEDQLLEALVKADKLRKGVKTVFSNFRQRRTPLCGARE